MAFRLRRNETVGDGFRRLARSELKRARRHVLGADLPRSEAVHEARKSVKKVRAIVQLIDDDHGTGLSRCEKRLRAVNRLLSRRRDADVMFETLARLRKQHPGLLRARAFAHVQRDLSARTHRAGQRAGRAAEWNAVAQELGALRRRVKRWRAADGGSVALAQGIRAAHRRGRKAMKRAQKTHQAADFHEWRKQIKALWYALRLVEHTDPGIRRDVRALHQAETWLGDEHNLVVLCDELARDTRVCRTPVDINRLRLIVDREQCRLRDKAVGRMRRLYGRHSAANARRVAGAWKRWRRQ